MFSHVRRTIQVLMSNRLRLDTNMSTIKLFMGCRYNRYIQTYGCSLMLSNSDDINSILSATKKDKNFTPSLKNMQMTETFSESRNNTDEHISHEITPVETSVQDLNKQKIGAK